MSSSDSRLIDSADTLCSQLTDQHLGTFIAIFHNSQVQCSETFECASNNRRCKINELKRDLSCIKPFISINLGISLAYGEEATSIQAHYIYRLRKWSCNDRESFLITENNGEFFSMLCAISWRLNSLCWGTMHLQCHATFHLYPAHPKGVLWAWSSLSQWQLWSNQPLVKQCWGWAVPTWVVCFGCYPSLHIKLAFSSHQDLRCAHRKTLV